MKNFAIIVAVDLSFGIGIQNKLPWHFSEDMKFFKETTTQKNEYGEENIVVMGRKTWESLPFQAKPLPHRKNIVLSSNSNYALPESVTLSLSLDEALTHVQDAKGKVFIIGGAHLYRQAIEHPCCQEIFLTKIHQTYDCDVFFPMIPDVFQCQIARSCSTQENIVIEFFHYQKGK